MRAQPFLQFLRGHVQQFEKAQLLAGQPGIHGGWEGWQQVEIACGFVNPGEARTCSREEPYPSGNALDPFLTYHAAVHPAVAVTDNAAHAARCDFALRNGLVHDHTHIELKCINPNHPNPLVDAWGRFNTDVVKIQSLQAANPVLNCVALLVTFGRFTEADLHDLAWFWGGNRSAYALDVFAMGSPITPLQAVALGGAPRLFYIAASIA